jgi:hypothetical protein
MRNRPDFTILLMAGVAIFAAVISGVVARIYGLPSETIVLSANLGFALTCYATTFSFRSLLGEQQLNELLTSRKMHVIDLSDLCDGRHPCTPTVERIWRNGPISRWVLLKAYAVDTKTVFRKILAHVLLAVLALLAVAAIMVLGWQTAAGTVAGGTPPTGVGMSLVTFLATLIFTVFRVYIPVVEIAQRNLDALEEVAAV